MLLCGDCLPETPSSFPDLDSHELGMISPECRPEVADEFGLAAIDFRRRVRRQNDSRAGEPVLAAVSPAGKGKGAITEKV